MKQFLFLSLLFFNLICIKAQLVSLSEKDLFRGGNINLVKLVEENKKYKGSPYLKDKFEQTELVFRSNRKFQGLMRYHMGYQIFEFKNTAGERFKILPENQFKIIHQRIPFVREKLVLKNHPTLDGVFQLLYAGKNYRLLHYLKKELAQTRKEAIPAPATGTSEGLLPTWIDRSLFILMRGNEGVRVEKSHKKMMKLKFLETNAYKDYIENHKVKLNNAKMLVALVRYIDQNQL